MPLRTRQWGHESDRQKWGVWGPRHVVLGHFYWWGKGGNGQKTRRQERACANEAVCPPAASSVWTRGVNKEGHPHCHCGYILACWWHPTLPLIGDAAPWSSSFVTSRLFGTWTPSCCCCCCSGHSGDGSLPIYREQSRRWSESRRQSKWWWWRSRRYWLGQRKPLKWTGRLNNDLRPCAWG